MAAFNSIISAILAVFLTLGSVSGYNIGKEPPVKDHVKNVIFMIGDGMGENSLELTKQELGIELVAETFPLRGQSMTRSFSSKVTDSAAGGTALATGIRTINDCISVFPLDPLGAFHAPVSLTEAASRSGLRTGVITSDSTAGATPASFTAHNVSRSNDDKISKQQMESDFDLIWGAACEYVVKETAQSNGFTYITSRDEMQSLENGSRSFGQFAGDTWKLKPESDETPTLAEMTSSAIDILDNEDGFFLMVEGAHIDKNSHNQNVAGMVEALKGFDNAIKAALDFAKKDGETMIVITADHETGGITYIDGKYQYTQGSHSGVNVPLIVYGSSNFIENGEVIKNRDVAYYTALSLGIEDEFLKINPGVVQTSVKGFFNKIFHKTEQALAA